MLEISKDKRNNNRCVEEKKKEKLSREEFPVKLLPLFSRMT